MPDTFTGFYNLTMPELGGSPDSWGRKLNENMQKLDNIINDLQVRLEDTEQDCVTTQLAYQATSLVDVDKIGTGTGKEYIASFRVQPGWIACANQVILKNADWVESFPKIARLYDALVADGFPFGKDSNNNPRLPDAGGTVVRNLDLGTDRDSDGKRALGGLQGDENKAHVHGASSSAAGSHEHNLEISYQDHHTHTGVTDEQGGHKHPMRHDGQGQNGGWAMRYGDRTGLEGPGDDTGEAGRHSHNVFTNPAGGHSHSGKAQGVPAHTHPITVNSSGGKETRVKSIAFVLCMRV